MHLWFELHFLVFNWLFHASAKVDLHFFPVAQISTELAIFATTYHIQYSRSSLFLLTLPSLPLNTLTHTCVHITCTHTHSHTSYTHKHTRMHTHTHTHTHTYQCSEAYHHNTQPLLLPASRLINELLVAQPHLLGSVPLALPGHTKNIQSQRNISPF